MAYPTKRRRLPGYMFTWVRDILHGVDRFENTGGPAAMPSRYKQREVNRRRNKVARASRKTNRGGRRR